MATNTVLEFHRFHPPLRCSSLLCLCAVLATVFAPTASPARAAEEYTMSVGLAQMLEVSGVRFSIASGRIAAACRMHGFRRSANSTRDGRDESITISSGYTYPSIRYRQAAKRYELVVDVVDGSDFSFQQRPRPNSVAADQPVEFVSFQQPVFGPIELSIGEPASAVTYSAPTVWHLLLTAPEPFYEHVAPVLRMLRDDWQFATQAGQIEHHLFQAVADGALPDVARWQRLVEDLGADSYARRVAADRELRLAGQPLLPFLRNLDHARLDAEQWYRIRRIIENQTSSAGEDEPHRVAGWLIADVSLWLAFLAREDQDERTRALEHLRRLLAADLDFDPAADPAIRAHQIERLRATLGIRGSQPL